MQCMHACTVVVELTLNQHTSLNQSNGHIQSRCNYTHDLGCDGDLVVGELLVDAVKGAKLVGSVSSHICPGLWVKCRQLLLQPLGRELSIQLRRRGCGTRAKHRRLAQLQCEAWAPDHACRVAGDGAPGALLDISVLDVEWDFTPAPQVLTVPSVPVHANRKRLHASGVAEC